MAEHEVIEQHDSVLLNQKYDNKLLEHHTYIQKYGVDPDEIEQWQFKIKK